MPILATTLFASAFLLFVCQPMVGKMVLPYLGGAAAVWTTCVLFFQAMLLAGYVYAHLLGRASDVRKQIVTHAFVLLLPFWFLPMAFKGDSSESWSQHPSLWLLLRLLTSVGVPFFVVSTTSPLLQNWLSRTKDVAAHDPYFLYSASNAGSLLALIAYPFLLEPRVGLASQSRLWFGGYLGLLVLLALASVLVWRHTGKQDTRDNMESISHIQVRTRFYWVAAAFMPSALMLAVTNHITADLASMPFLWIVPLAIYFLTFILAFGRRFRISSECMSRVTPMTLLPLFPIVAVGVSGPRGYNWIFIGVHLVLLSCGALLCHTALSESRPEPRHLTEFYFWIALGGVFGGVFTAIIAPMIFKTVLEYPLLVALLPLFRLGKLERDNWLIPLLFAAAVLSGWAVFRTTSVYAHPEAFAIAHIAAIFICFKFEQHTLRFALCFALLMMVYSLTLRSSIEGASRVYVGRNFFGVKTVLDEPETHLRRLMHGDILHGVESTDPARMGKPLSYFHPTGPVGDVIHVMHERAGSQHFSVIGLGSGSMAAYADSNHPVTFYEIDSSIEQIARRFFTFLKQCGANCNVVIGDGRLQLAQSADSSLDLLMLDAFSSDSIPTHLLSREAFQLYISKLAPGGVLLFHVSNRYLNVEQLVSALATDAGLVAFSRSDQAGDLSKEGKVGSDHVVAARRIEDLGSIPGISGWKRVIRSESLRPWTDDYSNLLGLIRWR